MEIVRNIKRRIIQVGRLEGQEASMEIEAEGLIEIRANGKMGEFLPIFDVIPGSIGRLVTHKPKCIAISVDNSLYKLIENKEIDTILHVDDLQLVQIDMLSRDVYELIIKYRGTISGFVR